jgi:hypothetical protein
LTLNVVARQSPGNIDLTDTDGRAAVYAAEPYSLALSRTAGASKVTQQAAGGVAVTDREV